MEVTEAKLVRGEVPDAFLKGSGSGSGDGSGDGDGSGYGYGDGDGYGSGSGYGYGSGDGDGYGSGDGDGSGSGSGYGYGDGDGDGSGYGSGYGDGDGSKEYWLATIPGFASKWNVEQGERLREVQEAGAVIAFWRSDASGRACNGGSNAPVAAGVIEEIMGPLEICTRKGLHATFVPPKWKGERWWIVALHGEVQYDGDKAASLKREVLGECL